MGAHKGQAQAVALLFIAFTLIAAGLAEDVSLISLVLGLTLLAASIIRFLQCKSWERQEK